MSDHGRPGAALVVAVAGHAMIGLHLDQRRHDLVAAVHLREAAAGEAADVYKRQAYRPGIGSVSEPLEAKASLRA